MVRSRLREVVELAIYLLPICASTRNNVLVRRPRAARRHAGTPAPGSCPQRVRLVSRTTRTRRVDRKKFARRHAGTRQLPATLGIVQTSSCPHALVLAG